MKSLIGAVLLIIGGAIAGLNAVKRLNDRTRTLAALIAATDYLQAEIKYGLTPLPIIMKKLAANYPELFFSRCAGQVTSETSFGVAWRDALRTSKLPLREDELQALDELGNVLGRFDANAQEASIQLARERLRVSHAASRDEQMAKSRLFGFMGVGLGVVVTILLI